MGFSRRVAAMVLELYGGCELFGCFTCTCNLFTVFVNSFGVSATGDGMLE